MNRPTSLYLDLVRPIAALIVMVWRRSEPAAPIDPSPLSPVPADSQLPHSVSSSPLHVHRISTVQFAESETETAGL